MSASKLAGILLGSAALVAGHGYVTGAVVDGTYYGGYLIDLYPYENDPPKVIAWSEDELDDGFINGTEYSGPNIICHKNAKPGALEAPVTAGGTVELQWTDWPSDHHGPVITYMANCNGDCASVDKTKLEFFKIDQGGMITDDPVPGTWATDNLIANNNSRTVTIPSSIKSGNYVLRHEIIALHSAENKNGAQNYPQCLNLKVTGGGSDSPSGTLGTELYKDTDPGILVDIWNALSTYVIPGPALYTASAGGATTTTAASVPATATATSTPAASATVPAPEASSPAVGSVTPSPSTSTPLIRPTPIRSTPLVPSSRPSFSRTTGTPVASPSLAGPNPGGPEQSEGGAPTHQPTPPAGGDGPTGAGPTSGGPGSESGSGSESHTGSGNGLNAKTDHEWMSFLNSLSAEQFLTMMRETVKWLITDKKHSRDLSAYNLGKL
ncbi:hypothetical protein N7474_000956 [Penicillium riverlandense]|uniref:uncharacterized protein n=1 Tax=Penicillium riverlandense TaxID=1903569 RepID=UPI002547F255|nr:uncharacterized protein N7474_000956 [Penicillium riverlandense]KAJ5832645.1 hypothetical protein N7474_000956 [Penicillium riverlandense]